MKHEVFVIYFFFLLNLRVVEGEKKRSRIVNDELVFGVCQLFSVDQLMVLFSDVVEYSRLFFIRILILIFDTKDAHFSDVNEIRETVRVFFLHFHNFGVVVEGKTDLPNGGRLIILCCIDNEVFKGWTLIDLLLIIFLIYDEVDVWLYFPYCIHDIVSCIY